MSQYQEPTPLEKFIASHYTGKRDGDSTAIFVEDFAGRIEGRVQITSDAWASYPALIREHLLGRLDYAVMQKIYEVPKDYSDAARVYSPPTCKGVHVTVKAGAPRREKINTSFVERVNLSVRHFNKRFVRLGLGWSRKLENHRAAVALFVASHNFVKRHQTLGTTPAHGIGLAEKPWKVEELIEAATATTN